VGATGRWTVAPDLVAHSLQDFACVLGLLEVLVAAVLLEHVTEHRAPGQCQCQRGGRTPGKGQGTRERKGAREQQKLQQKLCRTHLPRWQCGRRPPPRLPQ
jgi:hypothetical protein